MFFTRVFVLSTPPPPPRPHTHTHALVLPSTATAVICEGWAPVWTVLIRTVYPSSWRVRSPEGRGPVWGRPRLSEPIGGHGGSNPAMGEQGLLFALCLASGCKSLLLCCTYINRNRWCLFVCLPVSLSASQFLPGRRRSRSCDAVGCVSAAWWTGQHGRNDKAQPKLTPPLPVSGYDQDLERRKERQRKGGKKRG